MGIHISFNVSDDSTSSKKNRYINITFNKIKIKPLSTVGKIIRNTLLTIGVLFLLILGLFIYDTYLPKTKITHSHKAIENPDKFDRNCYISETDNGHYKSDKVITAAKLLYERTGVQFYYLDLDITDDSILTESDVDDYIDNRVTEYTVDEDYAIVYVLCNNKVVDYKDGYANYIGGRDLFVVGSKADNFFDSEGEAYFAECFDLYYCAWNFDEMYKCFDKVSDDLLNYESKQITKIITITVVILIIICLVAIIIGYKLHRQRVEDTIKILNTSVEELGDDYLEEKYGDLNDYN